MANFADDTAVTAVADGGPGDFAAKLSKEWSVWGPNGGYLTAIALRAAGKVAAIERPVAITTHFFRAGAFEDVQLTTQIIQSGRMSESIRVSMSQHGKPVIEAMVRTAVEGPGYEHVYRGAPEVPEPESLSPMVDLFEQPVQRAPLWSNIEDRIVNPERVKDRRVRAPHIVDWYRFRSPSTFDDPWLEAGRSAVLIDAVGWGAAMQQHVDQKFSSPTIESSISFHASAPTEPWLLCEQVSPLAAGGLVSTNGRVWSRDGTLLASGSMQILCGPLRSN